jgi:hypothetical protein
VGERNRASWQGARRVTLKAVTLKVVTLKANAALSARETITVVK